MKTVKINGKEYPIDSSGAIPKKHYNSVIWKLNDLYHRIDGPAIIYNYGYQDQEWTYGRKDWWYLGQCLGSSNDGYTQEDFEQYVYLLKHPELKAFQ